MKDKIPANRSDGYMVMKDKIPGPGPPIGVMGIWWKIKYRARAGPASADRSDGYMMKDKMPGPGGARARPDLSQARPGVSSDRKSKENLCKIKVWDQKLTLSTAFCKLFVWWYNFCRDVRNGMYVFAISSEIFDTLRSVYWYLHFQVDILRSVFDSCDAEVPRGLHILE